jgi:hypothetical protein
VCSSDLQVNAHERVITKSKKREYGETQTSAFSFFQGEKEEEGSRQLPKKIKSSETNPMETMDVMGMN